MSDLSALPTEPPAVGAGELLRAARQKQGLHIAALAASIKVTPAKLEALEAGRYDELPDATFTRALAQSVCRVLKIDAQPVLSLLPSTKAAMLEKVDGGLNTPFRERPGRIDPTDWAVLRQPALWMVLLLLGAAAAFALLPADWSARWVSPGTSESAQAGAQPATPSAAPASVVEVVRSAVVDAASAAAATVLAGSAPTPAAAPATAPSLAVSGPAPAAPAAPDPSVVVAGAPSSGTRLRAIQDTWVQASDARGQLLLNRTLLAGEVIDLEGARPLRLRIGNVAGTVVQHRGQALDLASRTQNNVASLELP